MKKFFLDLLFPALAVVFAFLLGGGIVLLMGDSPLAVYELFFSSAFGSLDGIGYTLFYATPLIFTGLAVSVAFKCGLLNIGAEGQLTVGAFAAAWVGFTLTWLPSPLLVAACILGAMAAGGLWAAVPGFLKARFGSHEVINTIMMNFIAVGLVSYLVQYHYRETGDPILQTYEIASGAHLARMHKFIPAIPERIPLSLGFLIALLACGAVYVFLWKTKWGYELRAVGSSPTAAEYAGINVARNIVLAMVISGALAGLVATGEVLGYRHRYYDGFSPGYGFTGIAVALLGRNHPVGIVLAAILFGALIRSQLFIGIFTEHVSKDLTIVLQAIIILCVACEYPVRTAFAKLTKSEA
ncbi:MAG: ABC transporter permease [Chloracidobacterium sp.]|uniref:ABC transporter permease n=1 Tax=Chloracidobacterium validum TaxID=2821543 RepID=A0ABX8B5R1_9BACT|nr:ABC transporter permease [Chloracidobacterium validum]QUW02303.1 ABC transporter permease [Chloracidobacterium validum]